MKTSITVADVQLNSVQIAVRISDDGKRHMEELRWNDDQSSGVVIRQFRKDDDGWVWVSLSDLVRYFRGPDRGDDHPKVGRVDLFSEDEGLLEGVGGIKITCVESRR
jgi:hypothetical protein